MASSAHRSYSLLSSGPGGEGRRTKGKEVTPKTRSLRSDPTIRDLLIREWNFTTRPNPIPDHPLSPSLADPPWEPSLKHQWHWTSLQQSRWHLKLVLLSDRNQTVVNRSPSSCNIRGERTTSYDYPVRTRNPQKTNSRRGDYQTPVISTSVLRSFDSFPNFG